MVTTTIAVSPIGFVIQGYPRPDTARPTGKASAGFFTGFALGPPPVQPAGRRHGRTTGDDPGRAVGRSADAGREASLDRHRAPSGTPGRSG